MAKLGLDEKVVRAFKLLSNPANLEILVMLSSGEFNPRELAKELGRDETDVSRRLRRLEDAGLVIGEWKRVAGRNIRVYRLRSSELCLNLTSEGITLGGAPSINPRELARQLSARLVAPSPPSFFAGRRKELSLLQEAEPGLAIVVGLPGIGKTSLLAVYASKRSGPVAWYKFTGLEDLRLFVWKLALHFSLLGDTRLYDAVQSGGLNIENLALITASIMDKYNVLLVLDDFHLVADKMVSLFVAELAPMLEKGAVFLASRRRPTSILASAPRALLLPLTGLSVKEARQALEKLGVSIDAKGFSVVYAVTQGHPLLLRIFASLSSKHSIQDALKIISKHSIEGLWRSLIDSLGSCEAEVLNVLAELSRPTPAGLLIHLSTCKSVGTALYKLVDSGLVDETSEGYIAREIVLRLKPRRAPRRGLLVVAGDWHLGRETAEDLVKALDYYVRAKSEKHVMKLIKKRIESLSVEMLAVAETYARLLEKALEFVRRPLTKAFIHMELGVAKHSIGKLRESFEHARAAYEVLRNYNYRDSFVRSIGLLLWYYPMYLTREEAEKLIREAEKIVGTEKVSATTESLYYANLARFYSHSGEPERVLEATLRELEATKKYSKKPYDIAIARTHVAIALGLNGDLEGAIREAEEALGSLYIEAPVYHVAYVKWGLAEIYLSAGRWKQAYQLARDIYPVFEGINKIDTVMDLLGVMVLSLVAMGVKEEALENAEKLRKLVMEHIGSWRGYESYGLATIAAYAINNTDYRELAKEVLDDIKKRREDINTSYMQPCLRVLERVGLTDIVSEVKKHLGEGE